MFFYGLPSNVIGKFLQKDINKYKECQANESRKNSFTEKKKAGHGGKQTQMPVTVTESIAAIDNGLSSWLFLQGSSVTDVLRYSKCNSVW